MSATFALSLGLALWSANSGMVAPFDALNVVYNESETRNALRLYGTTLIFTLAGIVFTIVALTGVFALPLIFRFVGLPSAEVIASVGREMASPAGHDHFEPCRDLSLWPMPERRSLALGDLGKSGCGAAMGRGVDGVLVVRGHVRQLQPLYGSLGAGVGFMVWLWISAIFVLVGGELNAEMEHQTAQDTTQGEAKPLGARGAMMANHVGKAQS